jgi:hypothetical protein
VHIGSCLGCVQASGSVRVVNWGVVGSVVVENIEESWTLLIALRKRIFLCYGELQDLH